MKGEKIVAAIERYRESNGRFPEQLSALVPQYMTAIDQPEYGQKKWDYIVYPEKNTFALFIWGQKPYQDGYWYDAQKREWQVVENGF